MSMIVPTVKIKDGSPTGYIVINESDFDKDEHELFEESEKSIPTLKEGIQLLIDDGIFEKNDLPKLEDVREACNNPSFTQEEFDACIKEHFATVSVSLHEVVQQLMDKKENLKGDGFPRIADLREASGNLELSQEDYDACIEEHFSPKKED